MLRLVLMILTLLAAPAAAEVLAARNLPAGIVLAPDDLLIPDGTDDAEAAALIGLQTRTIIYAGRAVSAAQLAPPRLVERNQIVTLVYESGALSIRAEGRALAAGAAGEVIRVMNLASRNTVLAAIRADGVLAVSVY